MGLKPTLIMIFENVLTKWADKYFKYFSIIEGTALLPSKLWPNVLCLICAVI